MKQQDDYYLLTRKEVEEQFGVCKRYLEIADANGNGPHRVLLGRSVRYRIKDIRDWIDSCTVTGAGTPAGCDQ